MGEVYRASDELGHGTVAVKLQRSDLVRDLEQASRLFEGAWKATRICHPHIVEVYETGLGELGPFVVMEDLQGEDLSRLLARRGRLDPAHAIALIVPLLDALDAAHMAGLIHGDIKPENAILCRLADGNASVKLLDFGGNVGWSLDRSSGVRQYYFGTADYLAPEQASGKRVDHRSDLFAICVLLFELLTNTRPFHGPSASATAYKVLNAPAPDLEACGMTNAEGLSGVLRRGLAKLPAERFQSAASLLEALKPYFAVTRPVPDVLADLLPLGLSFRRESSPADSHPRQSASTRSTYPPPHVSGERIIVTSPRRQVISKTITGTNLPAVETPKPRIEQARTSVLPARFRGKFHVRGVVWQTLDDYVRARHGDEAWNKILAEADGEPVRDLIEGTLQGIIYYDLDTITLCIDLASRRLFEGDQRWCRQAGRDASRRLLSGMLSRNFPVPAHPVVVLRRVAAVTGRLFDFSKWQAHPTASPRGALLTIEGLEPANAGLRQWILGVVTRSVSSAHARARVEVRRGENAFTPRMVIEVNVV